MSRVARPTSRFRRLPVPPTVWTLGFVSLFTDMGSEMVHALLPVLLVQGLGASMLAIGLIEGAAESLAMVVKVFSGYLSDAVGRRKPLVLLGYGLAAAVKPVFPLADSVATVTLARLLDRLGKGIRGAPRDALVVDVTPPAVMGAAFGLRQSMDTVGAVLGPLLAMALMWLHAGDIRTVLWWAVLPGAVAVVLLLRLREPPRQHGRATPPLTRPGLARLGSGFARLAVLGALFSLARFSEAFLILRATDVGLALAYVPLVLALMSLAYAATAYPAGRLADRMPPAMLLAGGMVMLALADMALVLANDATWVLVGAALWGLHLGLTQGVLASMVAGVAPEQHRGTAFGVFNLVSGVALLAASVLAGWLWDSAGPAWTFGVGAGLSLLTLLLIPVLGAGGKRPP
ncbi:MFS transporter [Luteimonas sp. MC1572]|nr:MFS transporter [Luteimonas sp. MC1572]MBJ6980947.1 MFS transporter [Luteimonas sp. MC1572]QQO02301.1 MFS transporter [Luteimonas sp. MC1572]